MCALSRMLDSINRKATKISILMMQIVPQFKCVGERGIDPKIEKLEYETPKYPPMTIETPWVI